ncbi:hypothetical protein CDAR_109221 [Caerostris darwini]|uniref:Uncharacterized protein n=1 Tax=Caerostris darwini TaxID=1538125 RepID=A0AAV4TSU8_9ARAC|nr:hypothetical protein CDAR_109221 [Caerostris darwini]
MSTTSGQTKPTAHYVRGLPSRDTKGSSPPPHLDTGQPLFTWGMSNLPSWCRIYRRMSIGGANGISCFTPGPVFLFQIGRSAPRWSFKKTVPGAIKEDSPKWSAIHHLRKVTSTMYGIDGNVRVVLQQGPVIRLFAILISVILQLFAIL